MTDTNRRDEATLAEAFLGDARDTGRQVSVYLVNGFQLKGVITEFDEEAVLFKHKDVHQLVMRSAIAAMYPLSSSKQGSEEWWQAYVTGRPSA